MNAKGYFEELNGSEKVRAVIFELDRAEGPTALCGKAAPVTTWKAADDILRQWAITAPDEGQGYDKCDFTVTYEDGETYSGRYDLKRHDMGLTDLLGHHIGCFVRFSAGKEKPDHMSAQTYIDYLVRLGDDTRKSYADFLEKYEIGYDDSKNAPVMVVKHDPKPEPKNRYMKTNKDDLPRGKPVTHTVSNAWERDGYNVQIWKGEAIRIYGYTNNAKGPVNYDITFKIGDRAEYDSYNLKYVGEIVSIGAKTVTIKHYPHSKETSRLDLGKFAWRNWDFDAEETADYNATESMYI